MHENFFAYDLSLGKKVTHTVNLCLAFLGISSRNCFKVFACVSVSIFSKLIPRLSNFSCLRSKRSNFAFLQGGLFGSGPSPFLYFVSVFDVGSFSRETDGSVSALENLILRCFMKIQNSIQPPFWNSVQTDEDPDDSKWRLIVSTDRSNLTNLQVSFLLD